MPVIVSQNQINILKNKLEAKNIKFVIMGVDFGYESEMLKLIENLIKLLPQIINDQESKALLEIDNTQSKLVKNIIYSYLKSPKIKLFKDLAGNNRLVEINEII